MAYTFECFQEDCTFMLRADTKDEVVRLVKAHAAESHGLEIDRETIESEMEHS